MISHVIPENQDPYTVIFPVNRGLYREITVPGPLFLGTLTVFDILFTRARGHDCIDYR